MLRIFRYIIILTLLFSTPIYAAVNQVSEEDGDPSMFPWKVKVPNGSMTNNGDGTASLSWLTSFTESDPLSWSKATAQTLLTGSKSGSFNLTTSGDISCAKLTYTSLDPAIPTPTIDSVLTAGNTSAWQDLVLTNGSGTFNYVNATGVSSGYKIAGLRALSSKGILDGSDNYFIGFAGNFTMTGTTNLCFGGYSGLSLTDGINNVFMGAFSGYATTGGSDNVMLGALAGGNNILGSSNMFMGSEAGGQNDGGSNNVCIGAQAGYLNEDSSGNTFIGKNSGRSATGGYNTCIGYEAGYKALGTRNVNIGVWAGYWETGSNALYIDSYDRGSTANDKAKALVYGVFDADPANQTIKFNANATVNGTLGAGAITGTSYLLNDANTSITEDGSGNLTLTDANAGAITLTALKSMRNIWIHVKNQLAGELTLADGTNWAAQYSFISSIKVKTTLSNWNLYLCETSDFITDALMGTGTVFSDGTLEYGVGYFDATGDWCDTPVTIKFTSGSLIGQSFTITDSYFNGSWNSKNYFCGDLLDATDLVQGDTFQILGVPITARQLVANRSGSFDISVLREYNSDSNNVYLYLDDVNAEGYPAEILIEGEARRH